MKSSVYKVFSGFMLIFVCVNARRKPPNILLIVPDDVGYGDFHYTGHPTQEKNEIDQLAEEGLRFTHYVATGRGCTPNRAAMLTSKTNFIHGLIEYEKYSKYYILQINKVFIILFNFCSKQFEKQLIGQKYSL